MPPGRPSSGMCCLAAVLVSAVDVCTFLLREVVGSEAVEEAEAKGQKEEGRQGGRHQCLGGGWGFSTRLLRMNIRNTISRTASNANIFC